MQVWAWVLVSCLATVWARPEGGPAPLQAAVVVGDDAADNKAELVVVAEETRPEVLVIDEAKVETSAKEPEDAMQPMPVPIEPGVMTPDDSKVFPEGSLRSPTPAEDSRVLLEEEPAQLPVVNAVEIPVMVAPGAAAAQQGGARMTRASYLPAEARGADSEDIERRGKPRRGPSRQLTDIHLLFLSHPEHAARVSAGASRRPDAGLGLAVGALALEPAVVEGRSNPDPPTEKRAVRKLDDWSGANADIEARPEDEQYDGGDGQPERMSLFPLADGEVPAAAPKSTVLYLQQHDEGPQQPQQPRDGTVTITTYIPTITAVTTRIPVSSAAKAPGGEAPGVPRVSWPLSSVFPIVIQDPVLGLYSTWLSGGVSGLTLSNIAANVFEYGPAADVCGGLGGGERGATAGKRFRRARAAQEQRGAEGATIRGEAEKAEKEADDSLRREDGGEEHEVDDESSTDGVGAETTTQEAVTEDASSTEQDTVSVENGENSLPSEEDAYREDEDASEDRPNEAVEKKLRKTKNKVDKRVQKVVSQVGGLTRRVQARIEHVLAESGVHDADTSRSEVPAAAPSLTRIVLRRGGVAVAGPGGIATAAFGGTAIVGPGGIAYTAPDSTAVVGPGARVVAVPSERLLDMYRAFRQAGERGLPNFRPSWLGTIPDDGKVVAVGPAVYRNPPEAQDLAARPAHWVFGNTRLLGL
ncbi:hypothetical protein ONE63_006824 [Megalurothrips usitatus]|uniref:DUF4774 domain-containing protein n=1 Tax=Megalurothrips usitatus TaxID=439358 RepID=A0AAV7XQ37_9NEOP|nr:hypothetical protein ONE63_006824 [Megalurothrips usitatus]